jgi:hypothetical protein
MKGWLQPLCVYHICVPPHTAQTVEAWPCSSAWQIRRGGSYRQTFDRLHLGLSVIISQHISGAAFEQAENKVLFLQHQSVL